MMYVDYRARVVARMERVDFNARSLNSAEYRRDIADALREIREQWGREVGDFRQALMEAEVKWED